MKEDATLKESGVRNQNSVEGQPGGEQLFLESLMEFTRSAKDSPVPEVAAAARRWEGILSFRIQLTKQKSRSQESGFRSQSKRLTSCRLVLRSPQGGARGRG
jgi:hypothetical protein